MNLHKQLALVTGASRGIGQAIAVALARAGAVVVGTATSEAGAEAITRHFAGLGLTGRGLRLDVNDAAGVLTAIEDIRAREGAVTILVNNAGITRDGLLMRLKDEDWDAVLDTNLKSVFLLARAVVRDMMKARAGRIISIGSVVGASGNAGQANYAAAKAGMAGFTRALAREVGSRGITVNCVAPGFIDTDMTRALPAAQHEALLGSIPLGRLGSVEDVAQAVCFLASPEAGYITGSTLHVNGGMHME
ncbi:MAG: 3-oxoacyl-ACP reductase FabG [Pseudomonadota bacterium]|nr:3-oxoacyl-ACP reductase FabG [Pseudomonadota bacterium]